MKKHDSFWTTIIRCIIEIPFYKTLIVNKFGTAFFYLYRLFLLTIFIQSIIIAITIVPKLTDINKYVDYGKDFINNSYPKELKVTLHNGFLSTNVKEPYYMNKPNYMKDILIKESKKHFITIDTKAHVEDYDKYKTFILVTERSIVYPDKNGQLKLYPFDPKTNTAIDKSVYDAIVSKVLPYFKYIEPFVYTLVFGGLILYVIFGSLFLALGRLIFLLFTTLIFLIIAKIWKKDLHFSSLYILGMYGSTLSIIIQILQKILHLSLPYQIHLFYGNLSFFVFIIYIILVMKEFPFSEKELVKKQASS